MNFTKLSKYATTPRRKHSTDAGLDLYACLKWREEEDISIPFTASVTVYPHSFALIPTLIAVEIPEGCVGLIWPKSKNDYLIGGGVVDYGYTGQILVKVMNTSSIAMEIRHGDPIGQLIIQKVEIPELVELPKDAFYLKDTERGASGGILSQYKQASLVSKITEIK
jgi:dUTP pyrophosphatase